MAAFDPIVQKCRTQQFIDAQGYEITQHNRELYLEKCIEFCPSRYISELTMVHEILRMMISNIYSKVNVNISKECIVNRMKDEIYVYKKFIDAIHYGYRD